MLTVDVDQRIDINIFMRSPWIAATSEVPTTPLGILKYRLQIEFMEIFAKFYHFFLVTSTNLMEDMDTLKLTQHEMETALTSMRVDEPTTEIKNPKTSNNKLIARRQKKKLAKLELEGDQQNIVSQNNVRDMVTD